jgi:hypothetical protein
MTPAWNNSASVRASKRSLLTFAWLIARTCMGFASATSATCGSIRRAIASALPVDSITTRSPRSRLSANNLSFSGSVETLPADRARSPDKQIATSQKSR